jgi:hypothetical protein
VPCPVAAREAGRRRGGRRRGDRAARPSPLNLVTYLGREHATSRTWRDARCRARQAHRDSTFGASDPEKRWCLSQHAQSDVGAALVRRRSTGSGDRVPRSDFLHSAPFVAAAAVAPSRDWLLATLDSTRPRPGSMPGLSDPSREFCCAAMTSRLIFTLPTEPLLFVRSCTEGKR